MNGGLPGHSSTGPVEDVRQMEKSISHQTGVPKDSPTKSKDEGWLGVDPKEAEADLSLYCKPVELYNIIQQRFDHQPPFLQRCLRYKIDAALQRRIRLTFSVTGIGLGKAKEDEAGPSSGTGSVHNIFVMVTRPVNPPNPPAEGPVYRLRQAEVLQVDADPSSTASASENGASFIFSEKKLVQDKMFGDVVLFIISAGCSGCVIWGKLAISKLCLNWMERNKDSASRKASDGILLDLTSTVDLQLGNMKIEESSTGKNIKISSVTKPVAERSLVHLDVHVVGGRMSSDGRAINELISRYPVTSSGIRPKYGQVVFHYLYYFGMLRKTEVTDNFSCPFCLTECASTKGLRCHLNATHGLFNFEYLTAPGEFLVVNVTCRPDVVGPQGDLQDIDGLSDPRVKNFFYWFRDSRLRRRRMLPVSSEEQLQVNGQGATDISGVRETSQVAAAQWESRKMPDLRQARSPHEVVEAPAAMEEFPAIISPQQHNLGDSPLSSRANGKLSNGLNAAVSNGNVDRTRKKESKRTEKSSSPQGVRNGRMGKLKENADVVGQPAKLKGMPGQKRQRIKGVVAEKPRSRSRPTPTFGGACASAGGLDMDDCGMQQVLTIPSKSATDRTDLSRTHALLQKRQYFHSHTAQAMDAEQLFGDVDSEDEVDTVIADLEDRRMLDDFVDVSPEEKEIMHRWNSFVRRNRVIADGHCGWGCEEFARENAQRFGENPALRRCLMLFLVKLWNHHLVDGATISRCLSSVDLYAPKQQQEPKK